MRPQNKPTHEGGEQVARLLPLAVLLVTALGGCAQPEVPPEHYYRLSAPQPARRFDAPLLDGVLVVPRFVSDGVLSERPLVYAVSTSPDELRQYHYHSWSDAPGRMLQVLMVDYLRRAGVADRVVTPDLRVAAEYTLVGRIKRLEQVRSSQAAVVLELEIALESSRGDGVLMLRDYVARAPARDDTVPGAVSALNAALADICARLLADLDTARAS